MKPIRLSKHAQLRLSMRGCTVAEIEETIRAASWQAADLERMECQKDFPFGGVWNGKFYATKRVRPIFIDNPAEIVVVTVYTYYF